MSALNVCTSSAKIGWLRDDQLDVLVVLCQDAYTFMAAQNDAELLWSQVYTILLRTCFPKTGEFFALVVL